MQCVLWSRQWVYNVVRRSQWSKSPLYLLQLRKLSIRGPDPILCYVIRQSLIVRRQCVTLSPFLDEPHFTVQYFHMEVKSFFDFMNMNNGIQGEITTASSFPLNFTASSTKMTYFGTAKMPVCNLQSKYRHMTPF